MRKRRIYHVFDVDETQGYAYRVLETGDWVEVNRAAVQVLAKGGGIQRVTGGREAAVSNVH